MTVEFCVGNLNSYFLLRKIELRFRSSGIWTHIFKSRKSEMELRMLTVAWLQKEWLLSIVNSVFIFNNSFNRTPPHNNVSYRSITMLYVIVPRYCLSIPALVKQRRLLNDVRIRVHVRFSEQPHSCSYYCVLIHLYITENLFLFLLDAELNRNRMSNILTW